MESLNTALFIKSKKNQKKIFECLLMEKKAKFIWGIASMEYYAFVK